MNGAHALEETVPAHRVVNRNGLLTGKHHFPGEHEMQARLEAEGIEVKEDQIVNFDKYFWDPSLELEL
jgi:methylated-DNA-protein-cysteine methyltransferase-like protein